MGYIKCTKCNKLKVYAEFQFTGKGKNKKSKAGTYRKSVCLICDRTKK